MLATYLYWRIAVPIVRCIVWQFCTAITDVYICSAAKVYCINCINRAISSITYSDIRISGSNKVINAQAIAIGRVDINAGIVKIPVATVGEVAVYVVPHHSGVFNIYFGPGTTLDCEGTSYFIEIDV